MIIDDYINPVQLTGYVREVPGPANLLLERFLPDRPIGHIEVAIDNVTRTNRAAKFRSWDSEVPIGKRDSFESRKVKIPPLGQKLPLGEYEALQLELARSGGNNRGAIIQALYDDADNNVRSIYNRMEIARGDVLMDGKFTLQENGLILEADFGVPAENLVSPLGADWDDTENATPLTDLRPWMVHYSTVNGDRPGFMVASDAVIANLTMNLQIRQQASGSNTNTAPFVTDQQLSAVLASLRFPPIVPYNTMIDVDDTTKRVIDEGKVVFLPSDPSSLGFTAWGITAEALLLVNSTNPQISFQQAPGLVGVVMKEGDPPRLWSKVSAVGMPILSDPRRLMVATVMS